ncbi:hypothetical protein AVEN_217596-1 [Araneus ventricosus]|uniref:Uncharacterized protein n=1 Tax=Araneus ventricosus TaxID=182803 RepID=A0A4Y2FH27_ARAVE|nr:hypothetical protein AVEN_217596-1 [Araneus ventricosus]
MKHWFSLSQQRRESEKLEEKFFSCSNPFNNVSLSLIHRDIDLNHGIEDMSQTSVCEIDSATMFLGEPPFVSRKVNFCGTRFILKSICFSRPKGTSTLTEMMGVRWNSQ